MIRKVIFFLALAFTVFRFYGLEPSDDRVMMDNYRVSSTFGDFRDDHFHTGLDLVSRDENIKTVMDGEVVFYNRDLPGGIKYGNGNFVILENAAKKLRVNYSHLKDGSFNPGIVIYKKGDGIARIGNTGASTGPHLHLEIEDTKKHEIVNPLFYVSVEDNTPPRLADIYFITSDNSVVSLIAKGEYRIKNGGELFVKCFDVSGGNRFAPYKINLFINGVEKAGIVFDRLIEYNYDLITTGSKGFTGIYRHGEGLDFYLADFYSVPGLVGIKISIEDFYGNKTIVTRSILVELPD